MLTLSRKLLNISDYLDPIFKETKPMNNFNEVMPVRNVEAQDWLLSRAMQAEAVPHIITAEISKPTVEESLLSLSKPPSGTVANAITYSNEPTYTIERADAAIPNPNAYYGVRTDQQRKQRDKNRAARKRANKAKKWNRH